MKHAPDGGGVTDESRMSAGAGAAMSASFLAGADVTAMVTFRQASYRTGQQRHAVQRKVPAGGGVADGTGTGAGAGAAMSSVMRGAGAGADMLMGAMAGAPALIMGAAAGAFASRSRAPAVILTLIECVSIDLTRQSR